MIKVGQTECGWSWSLVNGDGATAASGNAPGQLAAMETAWRQARSFAAGPYKDFPEVIVERPSQRPGIAFSRSRKIVRDGFDADRGGR